MGTIILRSLTMRQTGFIDRLQLDDHRRQYAAILTYVCLDPFDVFTPVELKVCLERLPDEGLQVVAQTLVQALQSASGQREAYWSNRVKPAWMRLWPKDRDLSNSSIPESFALLVIAAGNKFPDALQTLQGQLRHGTHHFHVIQQLAASRAPDDFASETLALLDAILSTDGTWSPPELRQVLDRIAAAADKLRTDHRYQKLDTFSRVTGL